MAATRARRPRRLVRRRRRGPRFSRADGITPNRLVLYGEVARVGVAVYQAVQRESGP